MLGYKAKLDVKAVKLAAERVRSSRLPNAAGMSE